MLAHKKVSSGVCPFNYLPTTLCSSHPPVRRRALAILSDIQQVFGACVNDDEASSVEGTLHCVKVTVTTASGTMVREIFFETAPNPRPMKRSS